MTDKYIIQLLNKLNRNPNSKNCIKVGIGKNVELAHIWHNQCFSKSHIPCTFFLIKENDKYVGAVLDMEKDLHWVILPKHRKKGYLSRALRHVILPYIIEEMPRQGQSISISRHQLGEINYQNSLKVALSVGFNQIDDEKLVLDCSSLNEDNYRLDYQYKGISEQELESINKELVAISKRLLQINTKVEFAFGAEIKEYNKPSLFERAISFTCFIDVFKDMKNDFDK